MQTEKETSVIRGLIEECREHSPEEADEVFCLRVEDSNLFVGSDANRQVMAVLPCSSEKFDLAAGKFKFSARQIIRWQEKPADEEHFAVLRLLEDTTTDIDDFVQVIASLLLCCQSGMDGDQLCRVVDSWFGLLLSQHEPSYAEILGFWGEVFVILAAKNPQMAASIWQWRDTDPIDFVYRGSALEVKSTTNAFREHSTSLSQNVNALSMRTVLASIMTRDEVDGASIGDLVESLLLVIQNDQALVSKLVSAYARRIGFSRRAQDFRFSKEYAIQHLLFSRWSDLPQISFDDGILDARWTFVPNAPACRQQDELARLNKDLSKVF